MGLSDLSILYVIGQLTRGGAEQQLYYLLSQLEAKATVLSLSQGGYWAGPIRQLGCEVIELVRRRHVEVGRLRSVIGLIRERRPDIVHVFLDGITGLYGRLGAMIAGHRRLVVGERLLPFYEPAWLRLIEPWLNRWAMAIVCNSRTNAEYLVSQGIAPAYKVWFIPNGVDIGEFSLAGSRLGSGKLPEEWSGKPVIGTVGRLVRQKEPETFVLTAAKVLAVNPDARFIWVGQGSMLDEAQNLADRLCIADSILFTGERRDVPSLLANMDVFVLTSRFEGMPNAVMEAMASGLPCVVTDAGGCSELVIDDETGYVVSVGDMDGLAGRILRLLADDELRRRMGQRGRQRIQREFDVKRMAERYRDLYLQVMSSAAERGSK